MLGSQKNFMPKSECFGQMAEFEPLRKAELGVSSSSATPPLGADRDSFASDRIPCRWSWRWPHPAIVLLAAHRPVPKPYQIPSDIPVFRSIFRALRGRLFQYDPARVHFMGWRRISIPNWTVIWAEQPKPYKKSLGRSLSSGLTTVESAN